MKNISTGYSNQTPLSDAGEGSVFYLDRHNVKCGTNQALTGFQLNRPNRGNEIQYLFDCMQSNAIGTNVKTKATAFAKTQDKGKSLNFLDRHDIVCPNGYAVQQFKLSRENSSSINIQYQYTCVEVQTTSCTSKETSRTPFDDMTSFYLDRQSIFVPVGSVLTQFKLVSFYDGKPGFKYAYTFCQLSGVAPGPTPIPKPSPMPKPTPNRKVDSEISPSANKKCQPKGLKQ